MLSCIVLIHRDCSKYCEMCHNKILSSNLSIEKYYTHIILMSCSVVLSLDVTTYCWHKHGKLDKTRHAWFQFLLLSLFDVDLSCSPSGTNVRLQQPRRSYNTLKLELDNVDAFKRNMLNKKADLIDRATL